MYKYQVIFKNWMMIPVIAHFETEEDAIEYAKKIIAKTGVNPEIKKLGEEK